MKITLSYFAQIRLQAGTETECVSVAEGATVQQALQGVDHGAGFRDMLFDSSGALRPMILLVVNGLPSDPGCVLREGDQVQLFSPVSGG